MGDGRRIRLSIRRLFRLNSGSATGGLPRLGEMVLSDSALLCATIAGMRRRWAAATVGWVLVIFFSSTSSAARWCESLYEYIFSWMAPAVNQRHFPLLHVLADKSVHFALFFILALLSWNSVIRPARIRFAIVLGIALLVGSTSEFLQRFSPGCDPSVSDVLINFGSAVIGALLAWNHVSTAEMRFVVANRVAKR